MQTSQQPTELVIARTKPIAPDTWEVSELLTNTTRETGRIPIDFPIPSLVIGVHVSVIPASNAGGLFIPTPDDLLVLVDLDNQRRFTSSDTVSLTTSAGRFSYVTLAALDTQYRDLYWHLESPSPVLGFTFRWKRFIQGTPLYEDAIAAVSMFVRPL